MKINLFSRDMVRQLVFDSQLSTRKRLNLNIHTNSHAVCQRLFNAIGRSSYIQPHRHSLDPKCESLIAIQGLFALLIFDNHGYITDIVKFGSEKYLENDSVSFGVELQPNIWHTVIALVEGSVLFEVKEGPFNPSLAKEGAAWAPTEGSEESFEYFANLRSLCELGD